jgi:hypothetical protein
MFEINHRARSQRRRPELKRARSHGALERRHGDPAAKRPDTTPASARLPTIDDNLATNREPTISAQAKRRHRDSEHLGIDLAKATHHDRKHRDGKTCHRQAEASELCGQN